MIVQCSIGNEWVQRTEAVELRETTGDTGEPAYGCLPCVRAEGIVPRIAATFIGHRDMAPTRAGAA